MPGSHIAGRMQSGSATLKFAVYLPCIYQKSHAVSIYPREIKHVFINAGTRNYKNRAYTGYYLSMVKSRCYHWEVLGKLSTHLWPHRVWLIICVLSKDYVGSFCIVSYNCM